MTKFEVGKKYKHIHAHEAATCIGVSIKNSLPVLEFSSGSIALPTNESMLEYWSEYKEPKTGTVWINIYPLNGHRSFSSKLAADRYEETECDGVRIACIEVPWTEGQGL